MLLEHENPPILSPRVGSVSEVPDSWWIAHTKSRFEKAFAWDLLQNNVNYFLPLARRVRISGGRKRTILMPLFPSYVFFAGDEQARYLALTTHRLCAVIPVTDQEELRNELAAIEKAVLQKAELDAYPFAVVGKRCRVTTGTFEGMEGVVVSRGVKSKFVLKVSILGQSVAMEIDADVLEPVDEVAVTV